ncbi:hypothetical protein [Bradyrhizobium sp. CCGE-LA001]|uniref:hypothetical protein n=1 Tax=Bradyrhizobium sp. CCGE-LA001 TaxID=1223566 RepID=UPI000745D51B|nr:hypothetical protein [Bradyrhizobium sp. CCGE-LA001]AMA60017.1 hypothetical protein BCCGELA001_29760 [Bradyrhizobium sp. CCGE-LA001]
MDRVAPHISRVALFACGVMGSACADNPPSRPEATTLADQKDGLGTPSAADQHRLPPGLHHQANARPARAALAFATTAGSIRLFDDKGEPQADIAYTSDQLNGSAHAPAAADQCRRSHRLDLSGGEAQC